MKGYGNKDLKGTETWSAMGLMGPTSHHTRVDSSVETLRVARTKEKTKEKSKGVAGYVRGQINKWPETDGF